MKKIKLFAWIQRAFGNAFEWLRPKAKEAIHIVNILKSFVDSNTAGVIVAFTPTRIDDILLAKMRQHLPNIVLQLQVTNMILDSGSPDQVIAALIEYLRRQNVEVRSMFYVHLAAKLTEAFADGKIDRGEAIAITQMMYREIKG
jgi:hypothetical protein